MSAAIPIGILTIGSEILDGRICDTNAHFIAETLSASGARVRAIRSCDDDLPHILEELEALSSACRVIICSGGIGPTSDDRTRDAIAAHCDRALIRNAEVEEALIARYKKRGRRYDPANNKQAYFPRDATLLPNPHGTAAGFWLRDSRNCLIASLPGVPSELKQMLIEVLLPELSTQFPTLTKLHERLFKIFGLPESQVGAALDALAIPEEIIVSYRAHFPEIHVLLKAEPDAEALLESVTEQIEAAIGSEFIFSKERADGLACVVHQLLAAGNTSIAVAESCTGGLLGAELTNLPGSSTFFKGGILSYSNEAKEQLLGVSVKTLTAHGAVSRECAIEMASGAKSRLGATIAVSITGIAGPDGGSEAKPVGLCYIGLATEDTASAVQLFFPHKRDFVRRFVTMSALDIVRRHLLELPLREMQLPQSDTR